MVVVSLALALAACSNSHKPQEILGTLERDRLELVAEAHEPITQVMVREGAKVKTGDALLRQSLGSMQARLDQYHALLQQAEFRQAQLVNGPRAAEILDARAALDMATSSRLTEQKEFDRVKNLVAHKLLSESALDQSRARRDAAEAMMKQTQARLSLLLEGTRIEELDQAHSAVEQAQAQLAELEASAARYLITAPRDGVIEALPYKLGERPPIGAAVVVMLAQQTPFARVYIPETLRANVAPGSTVTVRIDGVNKEFHGKVRYVSAQAAFTPYFALTQKDRGRLAYLAEIDIDDMDAERLPSGVPVQVSLLGSPDSTRD